jgi:hypothetical protein
MPEFTRIACPGCRTPLRFEPEALDFPASCSACECRFSVGVYVRVGCPHCHHGSKIRENYRGRRIRCIRCRHDFLADEGIPRGGGGRLLVARLLDTDSPTPPETIQPFLGHARERTDPEPASAVAELEVARPEADDSTLSATIERLNHAVASARAGEVEALRRLEEFAKGRDAADARLAAELAAERQRSLDLARVVEELKAEIGSVRDAEHRHDALAAELQWVKDKYEKLVATNEKLTERIQQLLADRPPSPPMPMPAPRMPGKPQSSETSP